MTDTTPAPIGADAVVAQLRHLYRNLTEGGVRDTAQAKRIAEGLLAPAITALERAALASAAQPAAVGTIGHVGDGPTTLTSAVAPLLATAAAPKAAPAQPADPVTVEAVAKVVRHGEGIGLDWLIEGGISALAVGEVLVCANAAVTDDTGSGEVYLAPAAAAPRAAPAPASAEEGGRHD